MAKTKIAYQGEAGSFSEAAAESLVKKNREMVPCQTLENVFDSVQNGKAEFGLVPIENSLIGSIHKTYDLLLDHKLHINAETQMRIVHCLIAPKGVSLKKITKVYSHPVALDQCRNFFKANPTIAPISYYDTAGSVKMLSQSGAKNSAAIAGPHAAEVYGMKLLKRSVEDEKNNHTRFFMLSKKPNADVKKAKTSIVFSMKNMPGVLFKALSVFALRDIDLLRIESRPLRKRVWEYHFYLDFSGSVSEERVLKALDHLGEITTFVRVLGSYIPATR